MQLHHRRQTCFVMVCQHVSNSCSPLNKRSAHVLLNRILVDGMSSRHSLDEQATAMPISPLGDPELQLSLAHSSEEAKAEAMPLAQPLVHIAGRIDRWMDLDCFEGQKASNCQ